MARCRVNNLLLSRRPDLVCHFWQAAPLFLFVRGTGGARDERHPAALQTGHRHFDAPLHLSRMSEIQIIFLWFDLTI